jgi:hypothetical protein
MSRLTTLKFYLFESSMCADYRQIAISPGRPDGKGKHLYAAILPTSRTPVATLEANFTPIARTSAEASIFVYVSCKDMCNLHLSPQFDSNNPRSILKGDCVAGCHCSSRTNSAQIVLGFRILKSSNDCVIDCGPQRNRPRQRFCSGSVGLGVRFSRPWQPAKLGQRGAAPF